MSGQHVAIVGSRGWPDLEQVRAYVLDGLDDSDTVISGGAAGVDRTAEAAADERGLRWYSFRPQSVSPISGFRIVLVSDDGLGVRQLAHRRTYLSFGAAAYARNRLVVQHSQRVVAFNAGTKGTSHTVAIARELGVPVDEISVAVAVFVSGQEEPK